MTVLKKLMVLSLLVVYLLISVACILYLPKYNPLRSVNKPVKSEKHLVLNTSKSMQHSADNMLVLLYRSYRATADTKKVTAGNMPQTAFMFILLIMGGAALSSLLLKKQGRLKKMHYSYQQVYLSHRPLRI